MKEQVVLSWSGGKDSTLALYELLRNRHEVVALLTTLTEGYDRISVHGVRRVLLEQQAEALGLPLDKVYIPQRATNEMYEAKLKDALKNYLKVGITTVAFGDIFLAEIRDYREKLLASLGMKGLFPLWQRDSCQLARDFSALGFKAVTTCIDNQALPKAFVGRDYDGKFLAELPRGVDPCGENGEFHTFVYDGPTFKEPVAHKRGEVVLRDNRFYFCDFIALDLV